jgi:rRNA maturation protein Nop10
VLTVGDLPGIDPDVVPLPQVWTVYRWGWAPKGLATRRQLRALNLAPGGRPPVAEIRWDQGRKVAYLYDLRTARTKRVPSPAQLEALGKAMTARRTCPDCGRDVGYCIPTRYRRCLDCHDPNWRTAA